MKVKIEDFLQNECRSWRSGRWYSFLWMRYVWMRVSKICQDGEKRNFEVHERKEEG